MLSLTAVKAAKPMARAQKMFDGGGLFLFIAPTGLKSWRMKYRFSGKEKLLTFGKFPAVSLQQARSMRDQARDQLERNIDPAHRSTADDFESVARSWFRLQRDRWSPVHANNVLSSLERDVFASIGSRAFDKISAPDVLKILQAVENRGKVATARRLRQRLSAIFRYAISLELTEKDPAAIVDQAMKPAPLARPQEAFVDYGSARRAMAILERTDAMPSIKLASRFLALTAVRMDSVRGARWEEFDALESENRIWRVPPQRMKLSTAKKQQERFEHLVPLSLPALDVLRAAAKLHSGNAYMHSGNGRSGNSEFPKSGLVFPGRDSRRPIGAGSIRGLYVRAGFGGRHVPHGWRASFSTIINGALPLSRAAIDLALAHTPKDRVEAAYNRSVMLTERRMIFDRWGEMLCGEA